MLIILFAGLLTVGLAAQYQIHPDDTPCLQQPCHTLKYFTDNSDEYFVSNTTLNFIEGEYHHIQDLTVQNVTNLSLIGTPNISNPTVPLSTIKCIPENYILFHDVINVTIQNIQFKECGSGIPKHTFYSERATIFILNCTGVNIVNMYIHKPIGYGIIFYEFGNSTLVNVTIILGSQNYKPSRSYKCSYGVKWINDDTDIISCTGTRIFIIIKNIIVRDIGCDYVYFPLFIIHPGFKSMMITIMNSNFTQIKHYRIFSVIFSIISCNTTEIFFHKCNFILNTVKDYLIGFW